MTQSFRIPSVAALIQLHAESIETHGGAEGAPDLGKLEACVARAGQMVAYSDHDISVFEAAAAITFAIVKIHHPAPDGNKRLGLIALNAILGLNGWLLDATESDAERNILGIASGDASEEELAGWIKLVAVRRQD